MKPIYARTCTRAWLEAATHLEQQPEWREYNIVLEVDAPFTITAEEKPVFALLDKFLRGHGGHPVNTVVNTIFPATLYTRYGADAVLSQYAALIPRINQHDDVNWGTYAMRMNATLKDAKQREFTPLTRLIDKMAAELKQNGPKQAAYEMSIYNRDIDFEIPIYDCTTDGKLTRGGPCLSHLSFKLKADRKLMLTAFYRSHHYVQRALGNLYGLAWLQRFVADKLKIETAEIVCISSMATLDTEGDWGTREVAKLLRDCRKQLQMPEPQARAAVQ